MKINVNKFKLNSKSSVIFLSVVSLLLIVFTIISYYWFNTQKVRSVQFRGVEYININELNDLAQQFIGLPKDSVDLFLVENQIIKHPYVENCYAKFSPENALNIKINEVVPIGYCSFGEGTLSVISQEGKFLPYEIYLGFEKLPLITGLSKTTSKAVCIEIVKILTELKKNSFIFSQISDLKYSNKLKGFLMITSGITNEVIIGNSENIADKIEKFKVITENKFFVNNFSDLKYIDLRWKDKIIVKKI